MLKSSMWPVARPDRSVLQEGSKGPAQGIRPRRLPVGPPSPPPVTAAVRVPCAQSFHRCFGEGSGGPRMPHESQEAAAVQ